MKHKDSSTFQPVKYTYLLFVFLFTLFVIAPWAQAENITLAWDNVTPNPDGYRVFQRLEGQSYNFSNDVYNGSGTTCEVRNLAPDSTYYFVVRARLGQSESGNSNEVTYTTAPLDSTDTGSGDVTDPTTSTPSDTGQGTTTDDIIIIDNGDSGSSSTGTWKISGGANPFGGESLYSKSSGGTYNFRLSKTGDMDIFLWWTEWSSRSTSVPVRIYDGNSLIDTVYVNQKNDGGIWNLLGNYHFNKSARVSVVSQGSSNSTCADAVMFELYPQSTGTNSGNTVPDLGQDNKTDEIIIIDNGDGGSSSTGKWKISGGANPFGDESLYSKSYGGTYNFRLTKTGDMDIFLWWTEWSSRSTSVPVRIYDGNSLIDTVYVNQKNDGGIWNLLGNYHFNKSARVSVVSQGSSNSTCADAVMFSIR